MLIDGDMAEVFGTWLMLMLWASLFVALPRVVLRLVTRAWF